MNDDDLDRLLRANLGAHDVPSERAGEVRAAAHDELRHATRSVRRGWRAFEATASLAVAAAQLVWVINTLFAGR